MNIFTKKQPAIQLRWEWPDGRSAEQKVQVRVVSIKEQSGGLFGLKRSPSMIGWLPDGMVLSGTALGVGSDTAGRNISLVLPKDELGIVAAGDTITLDIVDSDTCIAVTKSKPSQ